MNPDILQKQTELESAVASYWQVKDSSNFVARRRAENRVVSSAEYLADQFAKKYRKSIDAKQNAYLAIAQALNTYDPFQSDSFSYWASLYCKNISKQARKDKKYYQFHVEELKTITRTSIFDSDISISAEVKNIIQENINALSEREFEVLYTYMHYDTYAEMAQVLKISKQRVYQIMERVIEKIKL
jgi:RNA polymerase sigma factor (sigma-70 family)